MSRGDRIKNSRNRENVRRGRSHRGHGAGGYIGDARMTGPVRRGPLMVNARPSPYKISKSIRQVVSFPWDDLLEDSIRAASKPEIEIGSKLYVSNLDHGVTNEDIRQLFSEIGELKRYAIHYDKNGRQSGSAEVVYTRRSDAFAALRRYNNVQLDGRPMKIEVLGDSSEMPISARVNVTGVNGKKMRTLVMPGYGQTGGPAVFNRGSGLRRRGGGGGGLITNGRGWRRAEGQGQGQGLGRGRGGNRRDRGRGRGKKLPTEKSADELDKELENYHAEAMHIS